ncbi:MAG: helix-turn-helix domain-containing protein [Acidobacteria bacterium]|nr:helix-turn-helix domain-containing protein [Acidobacteriota bacterium]
MRGPKPPPIMLTPTQRETLQRLERRQRSSQQLVRRVRIVLEAASGASNTRIAGLLGIDRGQVRTWRKRWLECAPRLIAAEEKAKEKVGEDVDDRDGSSNGVLITEVVEEVLADEPRPGTPPTFGPEQVVRIVALACENPREESGRPITHWTPPELADEAVKRGIVESISARSVGRFLGRGGSEASSGAPLETQRASGRAGDL